MSNTIKIPLELMQTPISDGGDRYLTLAAKLVWLLLHTTLTENAANNIFKHPTIYELSKQTGLTSSGVSYIMNTLNRAGFIKSNNIGKTGPTTYQHVDNPLTSLNKETK